MEPQSSEHGAARLAAPPAREATSIPDDEEAYNEYVQTMRMEQYPMLNGCLNLDYAGSAVPSKLLLDDVHHLLVSNLYGNSHSGSDAGQRSAGMINNARTALLRFFKADPELYDLVFTANATAAIKLIGEALRELPDGFSYSYHIDSHTSIIGLRELATESRCSRSVSEIDIWPKRASTSDVRLFAYPAQSNMTGARLPLRWCREYNEESVYVLLDAAAYASTTPLDVDTISPDFTVVSLYKIFGFPDLGALIVKKSAEHLFQRRKYFGGGTVGLVTCDELPIHAKKTSTLHDELEDGTIPIHSITAIKPALRSVDELLGGLERVSKHTLRLAQQLHKDLLNMKHANGQPMCEVYSDSADPEIPATQGPTIAFNLKDDSGRYVSTIEVDKLASIENIQLRTGSLCNPGGISKALHLSGADMQKNYAAGYRCGGSNSLQNGKPTGVIRASFGCSSTMADVLQFTTFLREHFCISRMPRSNVPLSYTNPELYVESLTIYPIKSCAGWAIPYDRPWPVNQEGLAWDREWCIVHAGTGKALSQKQYPKMALIRPEVDMPADCLRVRLSTDKKLEVDLKTVGETPDIRYCDTGVCEDTVQAQQYVRGDISRALSTFLEVDCHLVRFPAVETGQPFGRHSKEHLRTGGVPTTLLLSNESPILTITRASLDAVNEALKARGKRAVHHSAFRANVVLAEPPSARPETGKPWEEDRWSSLHIQSPQGTENASLDILGGCRRCQMICVDQQSGQKRPEVFLTLAKQRRVNGKVLFGTHCALSGSSSQRMQVGDTVIPR